MNEHVEEMADAYSNATRHEQIDMALNFLEFIHGQVVSGKFPVIEDETRVRELLRKILGLAQGAYTNGELTSAAIFLMAAQADQYANFEPSDEELAAYEVAHSAQQTNPGGN